jgi:murein L,D-transpeptidase YcbB/YkuD
LFPALLLAGVSAAALSVAGPARAQSACGDPMIAGDQVAATFTLSAAERATVGQFYQARRFKDPNSSCVWSDDRLAALRAVLSHAGDQGLEPRRYHPQALAGDASPARDFAATAMALRYAHDLVRGEVDEAAIADDIDVARPVSDLPTQLSDALDNKRLDAWLASLEPRDPQYAALVKALAAYRQIAAQGNEPPPVPEGPSLHVGASDARVEALKARLRATGDLVGGDDSPTFDDTVKAAVIAFQRRHGLLPQGLVGRETLHALNMSARDEVRTIEANLERRRYFGHVMMPTRIEVNTAGATATLFRDGNEALGMRAVVGDPKHPSPMLTSERVTEIVLDPPWVIPPSIIKKEMRPKEARDPGYFAAHDIHWSGKELVQSPGPKNALGRIKFEFLNKFSVYLHDTPAHALFAKYDRADSHGCIRLEKPLDLALAILPQDGTWSRQRLEEAVSRDSTTHVPVANGPQIVLTYWTAFTDSSGKLQFRDDLYGRDRALLAAMPASGADQPIASLTD